MNNSTLKRLQVVLNYIDKDEVSYLEIENLMPDFVKKAILDGREFRMTYNQDFGYLISFESRDTEKVDEKDLKTSKNNMFAEMEHYSNKNGELCTSIEFKIDDKKWRVIFDFIDEECDNRLYPLYIAYEDSNNNVLRTCYFDGEKSLVIKKTDDKNGNHLTQTRVVELNNEYEIEVMKNFRMNNDAEFNTL